VVVCPRCGKQLPEGARFCSSCAFPISAGAASLDPRMSIWFQNYYRIRKKVVAIANQYWIEDRQGSSLGYTRQKLIRLMEDIRIFADESMSSEIFRIKQEQMLDIWGTFAVIDSATNTCVGKIRRKVISQVAADEYHILDPSGQQIGRVVESSGRGLARKFLPGGGLIPEHVGVEFYGKEVAEIKQQFKIIGDSWEVDCSRVPPNFDRRALLACMITMAMIERDRK
jgi:uncharacterized protein YxjI